MSGGNLSYYLRNTPASSCYFSILTGLGIEGGGGCLRSRRLWLSVELSGPCNGRLLTQLLDAGDLGQAAENQTAL